MPPRGLAQVQLPTKCHRSRPAGSHAPLAVPPLAARPHSPHGLGFRAQAQQLGQRLQWLRHLALQLWPVRHHPPLLRQQRAQGRPAAQAAALRAARQLEVGAPHEAEPNVAAARPRAQGDVGLESVAWAAVVAAVLPSPLRWLPPRVEAPRVSAPRSLCVSNSRLWASKRFCWSGNWRRPAAIRLFWSRPCVRRGLEVPWTAKSWQRLPPGSSSLKTAGPILHLSSALGLLR
mmetsp:Transcript_63072/g.163673  ORF Transcript_63072/g.163673 Transcript_63072/m.163673 type:complete len:232 (-) Transcript_63072:2003-2698(-)